ncbi:MAG: SUMF1/EgtB/PvdO family nonheme iron enzyme [Acidobacteria bacterium]|nr:SUMF1/EgtB/PvdO family nonheme iron enzyme [Acidobacteriota bacterium]
MLADDIFLIPVLLEHIEPEEIPVSLREIGWVFLYEEDGWNDLMRALKHGMKQRAIDERDERKKEEDTVRQNGAEAARLEREAAEQRLREETARLQKEKAEIERKLYEETTRRQQEEAARLKKEREAADLRQQAEAAQKQKEQAEQQRKIREREQVEQQRLVELQQQAEAAQKQKEQEEQQRKIREREQTERQRLAEEEALHSKPYSSSTISPRTKNLQFWPAAIGVVVIIGLLGYWVWNVTKPDKETSVPITINPTPAPGNGQTFEFETVRLDRNGKEVERRKLQARYFTEDLGKGVNLDMVEIPGGTFTMGSPSNEAQRSNDEGPQHSVNVASFWMGKFEITQAQWQALMGSNPSNFKGDVNLPVEGVSWNDTQEFLKKLNALPNLKGKNYRLPSEAEWEYAARAGTTTPFAFGETITPQIINYDGNYPYANAAKGLYRQKTVPVGSLGVANAFGLFDMHGNVWEWCQDVWYNSYNGAPSDGSAWLRGGGSSIRVLRGGSWGSNGNLVRSASRWLTPGNFIDLIGFRVVCART